MKTYILANWKANKNTPEAISWLEAVSNTKMDLSASVEIIICVPFIHLHLLSQYPQVGQPGVQDISPYASGAYTGAISAQMVQNEAKYVLLGHSERHRYFHETVAEVAMKVSQALEYKITPIVAVTPDKWHRQLNSIPASELKQCLILYEPPEAISQQTGPVGVGEAAPLSEVVAAIAEIKASAPDSPVLYGGSVKSHNINEFLSSQVIDGVVPGSASLNAEEWLKIIAISQKIRG